MPITLQCEMLHCQTVAEITGTESKRMLMFDSQTSPPACSTLPDCISYPYDALHTPLRLCLQLIQRRCGKCNGSGLVERGPFLRKCPECGGFFPWQGWKQFLTSTAAPGNGGVLRQPRNQDGVIYR